MFHNVLVGYEGSERSEDALALALALAGPSGAVTAACSYWWQPLSARVAGGGPGEAKMRAGAEIETAAVPGASPAKALRDLAEEGDHDLVVVGSTHRGAAGRVLAGTTADVLLRDGPCAVAVAPLGYREGTCSIRQIGVAFDGSKPSRAALETAYQLAAERGSELVVLYCFSSIPVIAAGGVGYGAVIDQSDLREVAQDELDQAVADLGSAVSVTGELLDGEAGAMLAERSARLDLLVVGSKGHGPIGRVLLGSVSHHLMCHSAAPVLVVPPAR
jgi:nucleotide-binding universal stress UspA family protein